jgi:hypothetical protein
MEPLGAKAIILTILNIKRTQTKEQIIENTKGLESRGNCRDLPAAIDSHHGRHSSQYQRF